MALPRHKSNPIRRISKDVTRESRVILTKASKIRCTKSQNLPVKVCGSLAQAIAGSIVHTNAARTLNARAISLAKSDAAHLLGDVLQPEYHKTETLVARCLHFFIDLISIIRKEQNLSIDTIRACLEAQRIVQTQLNGIQRSYKIDKLIFCGIGWITTLYEADFSKTPSPFTVLVQGSCDSFQETSVDASFSRRSIAELMFGLGDILPTPQLYIASDSVKTDRSSVFHVASLNAATLRNVGHIEFEWTDTIGCHLEFDPTNLRIKLYRFPSLCELHRTKGSIMIP